MIKAVIFDCFGVLASETWIRFRDKHFAHDRAHLQEANDAMTALSLGRLSPEAFLQQMNDMSGVAVADLQNLFYQNTPDEDLFSWILRHKDEYRFSILSNIQAGRLEHIFSPEQIALFDDLCLSYEVGLAKPDKRVYSLAATRLGLTPRQCLFVDDSERNVVAAQDAGMQAILYRSFTQFEKAAQELLD